MARLSHWCHNRRVLYVVEHMSEMRKRADHSETHAPSCHAGLKVESLLADLAHSIRRLLMPQNLQVPDIVERKHSDLMHVD